MKPFQDRIFIEFVREERDDDEIIVPENIGDVPIKRARVTDVGPDVNKVEEGDIIFVKNFKPVFVPQAEESNEYAEVVMTFEGNVLAKYETDG